MIELLMTSMLMWMSANCAVDRIHPKHNPCQYNYNVELPKLVFLPQKELKREFYSRGGQAVGSNERVDLNGFYLMDEDTIFLENIWVLLIIFPIFLEQIWVLLIIFPFFRKSMGPSNYFPFF